MTALPSSYRARFSTRFCCWLVMLGTLTQPLAAAESDAPNGESQDKNLEELIQQGIRLRKAGNDEAALQVFHEAERRSPDSVRVLLHIAGAAAALGKWIECDAYFRKVSAHRDDPYFQRHRAAITAIENTLAKKVGRFTAAGTPVGAEIRLNGELIGNLNMVEPQTVEAGTYVLEASQPGFYRVRRSITIQPGVLTRESIELNELPANAPASAAFTPAPTSGSGTDSSSSAGGAPPGQPSSDVFQGGRAEGGAASGRWLTWTLAGLSVGAAATSGVAFWFREQHARDWNNDARCLNANGDSREETCGSDLDSSQRAERIAVVAGGAAVALGAGALVHWLATRTTSPGEAERAAERKTKEQSSTSLTCGFGPMRVACQGSF